jgi:uncharacterized protein (DUF1330 family)
MVSAMPYRMTIGANVVDKPRYQEYRAAIAPLLAARQSHFAFDFEIAETLRNAFPHPVTRVFSIDFPDRPTKESFFQDPAYKAIRERLFVSAVGDSSVISEHQLP